MTGFRTALVCATFSILLAGAPAAGEVEEGGAGGEDVLERGRQLVRSFEFRAAVAELERVAGDAEIAPFHRVAALELLGALHHDRRRRPRAREAFEQLLALDPGHEIVDPEIPPRVREFFQELRESADAPPDTTVEASAPEEVPSSGDVPLRATVGGETAGLARVLAFVRSDSEVAFTTVAMAGEPPDFEAHVDRPSAQDGLFYYVEAQAPSGHVLATSGRVDDPRRIEPNPEAVAALLADPDDEPEEPPATSPRGGWYTSWWFWTIVGVVVAGGTATAVALTLPEAHETGSLGSVHMP